MLNADGTPPTQALLSFLPASISPVRGSAALSVHCLLVSPGLSFLCFGQRLSFSREPIHLPPPPPSRLGSIFRLSLPEARLCGFHQGPSWLGLRQACLRKTPELAWMEQGSQGDPELGGLDLRAPGKTGGSCGARERFWKKGTEKKVEIKRV